MGYPIRIPRDLDGISLGISTQSLGITDGIHSLSPLDQGIRSEKGFGYNDGSVFSPKQA